MFCSGDFLPTAKVSWKPALSLPLVTCALTSASTTIGGAGTGTIGPMSRVRWTPLSIRRAGNPFGERDAQRAAGRFGELVRSHGAIGVGDAPERLGVVQVLAGDVVEPLALGHLMREQQREALGRGHEAALEIGHDAAIRLGDRHRGNAVVPARHRKVVVRHLLSYGIPV